MTRFDWMPAPRRMLWIALPLALLLGVPSIFIGRVGEDTMQLLATEGMRSPFLGGFSRGDAFVFAPGDPETMTTLRDVGALPYWMRLDFKVAFWRPLSSALMIVDAALFGRAALPAHLHSVLWSLAFVLAAGLIYRRLFPGALGGLALLLFALDDARAIPTTWLANRNALVGGALAMGAIGLHLRWREREGAPRWTPFAAVSLMGLALLAGEIALGFVAYLVAYELLSAKGPRGTRLLSLSPYLAVVAAWLAAYKLRGSGAAATTLYVDPVSQPAMWLTQLGPKLSVLWGSLWVGYPADLWMAGGAARVGLILVSVVLLLLFGWSLRRVWPSLEPEERRHLRWLGLGALLSLVPVTSTNPSVRLLAAGSLGGAAVVAVLLRHRLTPRALSGGVFALLLLFHGVLPPLLWLGAAPLFGQGAQRAERVQASLETMVERASVHEQVWALLWGDPFSALTTPARWLASGAPPPRGMHTLSLAPGTHLYRRTGPATLELELEGGAPLLASEGEIFVRGPGSEPFRSVEVQGMRAEVAERGPDGEARRIRFEFEHPLEDPRLLFLDWREGTVRRAPIPPIGGVLTVTPAGPT